MLGLLKADLYRVLKDKLFIVLLVICVVTAIGIPLLYFFIFQVIAAISETDVREKTSAIGLALTVYAPFSNSGLVLAIFMIIIIGKDYSNGTVRNKIAMGKSREEVFFANLLVTIIFVVGIMTLYAFLTYLIGWTFFNSGVTFENLGTILAKFVLETLGWALLACMISFFTNAMKTSGLAVILYIAIGLGLSVAGAITGAAAENLGLLGSGYEFAAGVFRFLTNINCVYGMSTTIPGSTSLIAVVDGVITSSLNGEFYAEYLISLVAFAGLFVGFGYMIFNNRDLK